MIRRLWLFLLAGVIVSVLAAVGVDVWAGRRADAEFARLGKRFGGLNGRSIVVAPIADDENSARFVRAAAALTNGVSYGAQYASMLAAVRQFEQQPTSKEPGAVRAFVDANRDAIQLAMKASTRRKASWDAEYDSGWNMPHYLVVRTLANAVYFGALLDLSANRHEEAADKAAAGLALAASLRNEPALVAQLIRIAIATQQCDAVQRLIANTELTAPGLEKLARALDDNRQTDPIHIGLLGELGQVNAEMRKRPFAGPARRRFVLEMERLIALQSGPRPRPGAAAALSSHWFMFGPSSDMMTRGLTRAIDSGDAHNNVLGVTQIAVALRRYRIDRGSYPDELSALVPAYLARLPTDPVTGRPPVYARRGGGVVLKAEPVSQDSSANAALEWIVEK